MYMDVKFCAALGRLFGVCWWDVTMTGPGPCPQSGSWGGLLCSGCLGNDVLPAWVALGELVAVLDPSGEFLLDALIPGFASLASHAATRVSVPTALPWHEPPLPSPCCVPLGYQLVACPVQSILCATMCMAFGAPCVW